MFEATMHNELDQAIDALIANPDCKPACADSALAGMLDIAAELRRLPRHEFRTQLKADLLAQAGNMDSKAKTAPSGGDRVLTMPRRAAEPNILPTLFGAGYGAYPAQRATFLASFLMHTAAIALLLTSGLWMAGNRQEMTKPLVTMIADVSQYVLPPAADRAGGGGGGGDRDKLAASKGSAPRFAREQITPPAIVIRNDQAKLTAEPTVVGPPNIVLPLSAMLGDPLGIIGPPSNGTGSGGGIGSGEGGGVGSGRGPGVGPGYGGGIGGGVYRVGGGVSAPRALYAPDPEYSDAARKAKYQGMVVLWVVIDQNGRPRQVKVQRSLGMGLDEKAIEAVRLWKFEPARKDGQPVAVQVNVEVNFRLY
jgi:periplasmic protein TonB